MWSFLDNHKLIVTDIRDEKEVVSFDLPEDLFPVDLTVLGGGPGRKGASVCIASSDGKILTYAYSSGQFSSGL